MKEPSISIIQLVTPNIDEFAVFSVSSVLHYAKTHGYSHQILREKLLNDMHINWTKIEYLNRVMDESSSEYVLLIDADSIITNPIKPISEFLKGPEFEIYMPQDTPFFSGFYRPNAGFILVRNSQKGKEIIHRWLDAARNEGKSISDIHPRNQRVYWKYVMPYYSNAQKLLPRKYFKKPIFTIQSHFLLHFTSTKVEERVKKMSELYNKYVRDIETLNFTRDQLKACKKGMVDLNHH